MAKNEPMKIERVDPATLIGAEYNPRKIDDHQLEALKRSIDRWGFVEPVIVNKRNGLIVGGHQRTKAALELAIEEVPVTYVDLDEDAEKALNIALNKISGEWDEDKLTELLADLEKGGQDLEDLGFDASELDDLLDELQGGAVELQGDLDAIPEPPAEPITQPGDLWQLGEHRLLCGDSTNAEDVARLMDGEKAVLLHADPPYGMGKESEGVENDNLYREKLDAFQMEWWAAFRRYLEDNASAYIWGNPEDLWRFWYAGGLRNSERLTFRNEIIWDKKHGQGMSSGDHRQFATVTERALFFMLGEQGFNNNADNYWQGWEPIRVYLKSELAKVGDIKWAKRAAGHSIKSGCHWFDASQWSMPTEKVYKAWQTEANGDAFKREYDDLKREYDDLKREHDKLKAAFYETRAYFDNTHDNMTDVWSYPRVTGEERFGHATPKPVEMAVRAIKSSSPLNSVVVEPFSGSGTTIIAAEQTGRKCYAMELSPAYCDVAVKRWEQATGRKAERIS